MVCEECRLDYVEKFANPAIAPLVALCHHSAMLFAYRQPELNKKSTKLRP
jgi:hypothetical protein